MKPRPPDPWLLAALLAPLLLLLLAGRHMGEPVADDYDFLHRIRLTSWSWLDGGGAENYWRPLARQAYYATFGSWMIRHPWTVALVHAAFSCLAAALLYRAFRPTVGRGAALAIATGPWMLESSRLLIAWPAGFQDLGALTFVALALHEAVAGRRWSFLAAGAAALLCKEVAAIALLTIPACPAVRFDRPSERRAWLASTVLLVGAWATAYAWVHSLSSLSAWAGVSRFTHGWAVSLGSVTWSSLRASWSLPARGGPLDLLLLLGLVALVPWGTLRSLPEEQARTLRSWWAWGAMWTVPIVASFAPFHPGWWPHRMAFAGFGILTAIAVTASLLHRHAIPILVALRLALLLAAPRPVREVAAEPPDRGPSMDVPRLSRLQVLTFAVRNELASRFATLPRGTTVVWEGFPAMAEHAFASHRALGVWYGDSTLRWVSIRSWMSNPSVQTAAIVEFQADAGDPIALVEPDAMRALLEANRALVAG